MREDSVASAHSVWPQSPVLSGSYNSSLPSSDLIPEPWVEGCDAHVHFRQEHPSTASYSLHVGQGCGSLCVAGHLRLNAASLQGRRDLCAER